MPAKNSAPPLVRQHVQALLATSPGYRALPAAQQREVAHDTGRVAAYLVDPGGLIAQEFRQPLLAGVVGERRWPGPVSTLHMPPGAFDGLVAAVDFPAFVTGLINGVFDAILNRSIEQMAAYAAAGSAALARLSAALGLREPVSDPKRAGELARLVAAARRRIARHRQQLLATTVLMGVNR